MNQTRRNKLDSADLSQLLPRLELPPEIAARVASYAQVSQAVECLEKQDCLLQAARLCAYALPAREAVWWAVRCAAVTAPAGLPEADREACALAEAWVRKPADTTRRQAMEQAQVAGFTTAEAWAAVAAFWSGDSMSPLDQPKVPPAPHLTGTAVAGSIILASVRPGADRQQERLSRFLGSARDIALGGSGYLEPEHK
jgi:hypothetical protein